MRGRIALFGAVGRDEQRDAHAPRQLFFGLRRAVIAIPDGEAASGFKEFGHHGKLVGVCRSDREAGDDARPAHPHMHPEAVEGLLEEAILAEGCPPRKRWQR